MPVRRTGTGMDQREQRLKDRMNRAQKDRGKRGLGKVSILDLAKYSVENYKAKSGKERNIFDILPFQISEPWYSALRTRAGNTTGLEVGDLDYKLEVPIHRIPGTGEVFLCLREAFGKPCILCESRFEEYNKPEGERNKDTLRELSPSWRCFYNVFDYEAKEEKVYLFEAAYKLFEEVLLAESEPESDRLRPIPFASLTEGFTISWKGKEKSFGQFNYIECIDIVFNEREPYDAGEILKEVFPLDKMLIIPTVEAVQQAFYGGPPPEEEEQEERTSSKSRSKERCLMGGEFGKDCNQLEECQECDEDLFRKCAGTQEGIEEPEEDKPKSAGRRFGRR